MKTLNLNFWLSCVMMALCRGFASAVMMMKVSRDANRAIIGDWKVVDEQYGWYKYQTKKPANGQRDTARGLATSSEQNLQLQRWNADSTRQTTETSGKYAQAR